MRIALLLASLLVLTGCAASDPAAETPDQSTEQVEVSGSDSQETQEPSVETPEEESEQQSDDAAEQSEGESDAPEPEQSEASEEEDSRDDEQAEDDAGEEDSRDEEPADEEPAEEESDEPQPTQTAEPTPTTEESVNGYTLAQVSERNSAAECWVVIDGGVYDLTQWIRSHPGGSGAILNLCGKDGTASFTSQHGGQAGPSSTLDGYYLAPLVG
jgi:cytochrome b involved in lipid metabolism